MPGQGWVGFAASFLGTWTAMTVAMMLPPLVPMLRCYRRAVEPAAPSHLGGLTACVGAGYFLAWVALGAAILPLGLALVQAGLRMPAWARSVPVVGGIAVLLAGVLQLTAWKARRLACCRALPVCGQEQRATAIAAWWLGLRLGGHCIACCAPLMVVLLVAGVMDLRAMAAVTLAIAAERLAPAGERVARLIGVAILVMGMPLVLRAAGLA
jgi:predicted metal-binding membrane protein